MENYIKTTTKLYVAVNENGEIVNGNDYKDLGPVFALLFISMKTLINKVLLTS